MFLRSTILVCLSLSLGVSQGQTIRPRTFIGFDRNEYPGDENLKDLRKTFAYTGYWLNTPPGGKSNSWAGKRGILKNIGFGFVLLFNGRKYLELKAAPDAAAVGKQDGAEAAISASREGFAKSAIIFLDVEEGGRLLPEQKSYIFSWIDEVKKKGYRPGVYCSGIAITEKEGTSINTAQDIQQSAEDRKIVYWVSNDGCPPSPGCALPRKEQLPRDSGIAFAEVWQFAQSSHRDQFTTACRATYNLDGNCYLSKAAAERRIHLDLNISTNADPSGGRRSK